MQDDRYPLEHRVPGARLNANGTVSLRPTSAEFAIGHMRGWLSRLGSAVAGEHTCAPPAALARPVTSDLAATDGSTYSCPECGQVFAATEGAASAPMTEPVSNVIPFPVRPVAQGARRPGARG